ncbi:glycosyltransferase family 31 protein [Phlyctema vagabunda]|uniref:Glycosyltransferase family 31 protein n=1 Tax=Phlyctema vagabunda TaxID=108571 RepID=A0ABR4PWY9_9HELO
MGPRRPLTLAVFVTILTAIVFVARYGGDGSRTEREPEEPGCTEHLGWLEPYQFTYPIRYASRDIITNPVAGAKRPSITQVDKPLFKEVMTIDLAESHVTRIEHCPRPLELDVSLRPRTPVDSANMIFGLQTTIGRLKATVKHLARWLPHTGAQLYCIVIDSKDGEEVAADEKEMAAVQKELRALDINATVIHPVRPIIKDKKSDSFAQRYFSLVNVMYAHRDTRTQWITLIDDDTFFPSMYDLQAMLSTHDHTVPQYIGSLSEDWWAVNHYGLMGFGGAGILLSVPMAKIIDDHTEECKENLRTTAGDISVMDCVYRFSSAKLTHLNELHQVDMHGDLSGFYESGRDILSLHHWKEGSAAGYKLEMEKMHLVADICDNCFLQRWNFKDEWILSNGFSIAEYPQGHLTGKQSGIVGVAGTEEIEQIDFNRMEETWVDHINVLHSLAPLRPKLNENQKVGYKLLDSMIVDELGATTGKGGIVRQVYFKEGLQAVEGGPRGMDTVFVLNWKDGRPTGEPIATPPPLPPPPGRRIRV